MMLMLTDPQFLYDAMDYWKEFYKRYIKSPAEAGADAIWLGDCNAFSSMVSLPQYIEHILPVTKELITYCEKELNIMIWLHNSEIKTDHVVAHIPMGMSFESIGPARRYRSDQGSYKRTDANKWKSRSYKCSLAGQS